MSAIIETNNDRVIEHMKQIGIYDKMLENINRTKDNLHVFTDKSKRKNKADYYIYFRDFENEVDNGFMSISIIDPNNNPDVVKIVEFYILSNFVDKPKLLWQDLEINRN